MGPGLGGRGGGSEAGEGEQQQEGAGMSSWPDAGQGGEAPSCQASPIPGYPCSPSQSWGVMAGSGFTHRRRPRWLPDLPSSVFFWRVHFLGLL